MSPEEILEKLFLECRPVAPASAEQIEAAERTLGHQFPSLFKAILKRSNGGEFAFARMPDRFLPENIDSLSKKKLMRAIWEPYESFVEANSLKESTLMRYLPFGDDYSGEIFAFDLKSELAVVYLGLPDGESFATPVEDHFLTFVVEALQAASTEASAPEKIAPLPHFQKQIDWVVTNLSDQTESINAFLLSVT